jgi:DNA-directed RNA polymerase specialized sigma24 family protein
MPAIFDGISPDDLVGEALLAFLGGESGLRWNPRQGSLEGYLCGILKNKFLMHARRNWRQAGSADDGHPPALRPLASNRAPTSSKITEAILVAARGDAELQDLIKAAQDIEGYSRINQQLSKRMNTNIPDVVNRRKRLTRRVNQAEAVPSDHRLVRAGERRL